MKYKVDFVKRDKAIHERTITDITIYSEDKALVRELAVRQFCLLMTSQKIMLPKFFASSMTNLTKSKQKKSISWVFKLLQSPWACLIQQYRKRSRNCVRRTLSLKPSLSKCVHNQCRSRHVFQIDQQQCTDFADV